VVYAVDDAERVVVIARIAHRMRGLSTLSRFSSLRIGLRLLRLDRT
jgi:hypothetical protein